MGYFLEGKDAKRVRGVRRLQNCWGVVGCGPYLSTNRERAVGGVAEASSSLHA